VSALHATALAAALASTPPWGRVLVVRSHELVMGAPGCGKTPFVVERVRGARRAVFFDTAGDFERFDACGQVIPAAVLEPDDLRGRFRRVCVSTVTGITGDASAEAIAARRAQLATDLRKTLAACCAVADEGGLVIVIDELGDLRACDAELLWLHRAGHKLGIASVMASACATDFPKRCRDTASAAFSFFQKAADDVNTLDREYGNDFGTRARAWRHPAPPVAWTSPVLHPHTLSERQDLR
jgi:hypothetical protein